MNVPGYRRQVMEGMMRMMHGWGLLVVPLLVAILAVGGRDGLAHVQAIGATGCSDRSVSSYPVSIRMSSKWLRTNATASALRVFGANGSAESHGGA
jgi:hypothetical protein